MGKKRVAKQTEAEVAEKAKAAAGEESAKPAPSAKGRRLTNLPSAHVYVSASYNNTLISVADAQGDVLAWSSAGSLGFKGPKKATPYAASKVVESVLEKLGNTDLGKVSLFVQGVGNGRDAAVRALAGRGLAIVSIQDTTPIPHNGCRPRKARRV